MQSPFPGMDPYIETAGLWEDFHGHLVEQIVVKLAAAAPDRYLVRGNERSYLVLVESEGKTSDPILPGVSVTAPRDRKKSTTKGGTAVAEPATDDAPHVLRAFIEEEHREAFVEIYEAGPEQRLITTLDVLSPSNKRPRTQGWDLYQRKRQSLLLGGVNLVEIDLLRGGQRPPMLDPWPTSPYTLLVAQAKKPYACLVWAAHFQRPLPPIPVPLARPDADIPLNLQPLIETIYQGFRYERSINYAAPLAPPLSPKEAAWYQQQWQARRDQLRSQESGRTD